MDIQKLTVGQMASLNYVTPQTLRHYDREGLLRPWFIDGITGYRYYHINQSARLDVIQYLQAHGIPLKQIRRYLDTADPSAIYDLLQEQLKAIETQIRRLEQSRGTISRMISSHKRYKGLPRTETPFYEFIPERRIFKHKTTKNYFDQDDAGYEMMLRELKESLLARALPVSYFCNVGTIVRKARLEKNELYSDEVFFFVEEDYDGPGNVETLPAGLCLCLCAEDFSREAEYLRRLLALAEEKGHSLDGDYICEVMEEFPGLEATSRRMVFKMQMPVTGGFSDEKT